MVITVQISEDLLVELKTRKIYDKEIYEEVIWDLIEDTKELFKETKRLIQQAEKEFKQGKVHTLEQVKKELDL